MSAAPEVAVFPAAEDLAAAAAARLLAALAAAQAARGTASVVLTGGRTGTAVLAAVRAAASEVDWSAVDVYWGDERFLPAGDPERNETQARAALLDHVPVDPARVHPMAPSDGVHGDDPDAAARAYAELLGPDPVFDVLLVGVGEEGHTLSVFPDSPAVRATDPVVAVRDCPKPPPTRVSLSLPLARKARRAWLMTTGAAKAGPVAAAVGGASEVDIPAAGVRGVEETVWFLDEDAAAELS
ncbi:6-phosphogluconolactonase [Actinokineospora bangkokensis]|uniref:6-phosphogluconolactonase n=1 Tax=Actinokineospora bangkokensis TaxID=1193682 RepID=A0A1Q9LRN7_9PSEU|nr:6-phosphogluconolactonase [Actinokineospora bangkokensis]OLR94661.1 6-phosphogluconolactonase [Actinokineospora bangkokensis]